VLAEFEKQLNLKVGQTSPDGKFTVEVLRCVGACGLAPVVTINDRVYGHVTPNDVKKILAEYQD
jgi:NADH-quinone oxidoreductase subunit E